MPQFPFIVFILLFFAHISHAQMTIPYGGYIGGSGNDYGNGVAVDQQGNIYVVGQTSSANLPYPETPQLDSTYNTNTDAFVAKISADGKSVLYITYLGGINFDYGRGIAVDDTGAAYIVGGTKSTEATFPVTNGPDTTYNGGESDAFIVKISPDGKSILYAGYIGGSGADYGRGIAIDSDGNAYVVGETNSTETTFPVKIGPDLTYNGGYKDAFIAKVSPDGRQLLYVGYVGGNNSDYGRGIAVDIAGQVYITGSTASSQASFPIGGTLDGTYNGGGDAFIVKIHTDGSGIVYSGYIGGNGGDNGYGVAVDGLGNAYIVGETTSSSLTFPTRNGPDLAHNGLTDAFVAKVNTTGSVLEYAGFIGGNNYDAGIGIVIDGNGYAYITGSTSSWPSTFPVKNGPDSSYGGYGDAFMAKIAPDGKNLINCGYIGGLGTDNGYGIALHRSGGVVVVGQSTSLPSSFPAKLSWDMTLGGARDAFLVRIQ